MSQATPTTEKREPPFDVNKPVIRKMARSDRKSAWIYRRFLAYYYDEGRP